MSCFLPGGYLVRLMRAEHEDIIYHKETILCFRSAMISSHLWSFGGRKNQPLDCLFLPSPRRRFLNWRVTNFESSLLEIT